MYSSCLSFRTFLLRSFSTPCRRVSNITVRHGSPHVRALHAQTQGGENESQDHVTSHQQEQIVDASAWIDALRPDYEEYLAHFRSVEQEQLDSSQDSSNADTISSTIRNGLLTLPLEVRVSKILVQAYQSNRSEKATYDGKFISKRVAKDVLPYLAIIKGDWAMVSWIVRVVTERAIPDEAHANVMGFAPMSIDNRSHLPIKGSQSIAELANRPIWLSQDAPKQKEFRLRSTSLEVLCNKRTTLGLSDDDADMQKEAIGVILSGLANMIRSASTGRQVSRSQDIMTHVLDTMAILHHHGVVPAFTYQNLPSVLYRDRAPPSYLDELFNPLLSAILDAEWNLFQDTPAHASYTSGAQTKIPGFQFSNHNNPKRILPFAHEIWLELLLWIAVRGGHVHYGLEIIQEVLGGYKHKWTVSSWRNALPATTDDEWNVPMKTLSTELLLSYVDALVDEDSIRSNATLVRALQADYSYAKRHEPLDWSILLAQLSDDNLDYGLRLKHAAAGGHFVLLETLLNTMLDEMKYRGNTNAENQVSNLVEEVEPDILSSIIMSVVDARCLKPSLVTTITKFIAEWCQRRTTGRNDTDTAFLMLASLKNDSATVRAIIQANSHLSSAQQEDGFQFALLVCYIQSGFWKLVQSSLEKMTESRGLTANWHARILVALATRALRNKNLAKGSLASAATDKKIRPGELSILYRYLLQSLVRLDLSHLLDTTYTLIGMLATIDDRWKDFCRQVMLDAKTSFNSHSHVIKSFPHNESPTGTDRVRHVPAALSPNLCAEFLDASGAVERVWLSWCQRAVARSAHREELRFQGIGTLIITQKIEPNLSMYRVLLRSSSSSKWTHKAKVADISAQLSLSAEEAELELNADSELVQS